MSPDNSLRRILLGIAPRLVYASLSCIRNGEFFLIRMLIRRLLSCVARVSLGSIAKFGALWIWFLIRFRGYE